jgi:superfamily II DNA helicase RecQ
VEARRQKAAERIAAVESYAEGTGCRRAALLRYFGETLHQCAGCGRCRKRVAERPLDRVATGRYRRLLRIFSGGKAPWGGALIEPDVLRNLAESPPGNSDQLAAVPGVGSSLAARLGGVILGALEAEPSDQSPDCLPLHQALRDWRRTVADGMGVPDYAVLPDAVLARIAQQRPQDRDGLRVIEGLGPRALAKWGDTLLSLSLQ